MYMKISFAKLLEINTEIGSIVTPEIAKTKFGYACSKIIKSYSDIFNEYQDEMTTLNIQNALTDDKTKEILTDDKGNYKYSIEGKLALNAQYKEKLKSWKAKEFEITPFYVDELPELTDMQKELFTGIFIKPVQE